MSTISDYSPSNYQPGRRHEYDQGFAQEASNLLDPFHAEFLVHYRQQGLPQKIKAAFPEFLQ